MSIGYDNKQGVLYAKICSGRRVNGKVCSTQIPLGRVIDKEKHIYRNRKRGYFTYDEETDTYTTVDASQFPPIERKNRKEKLIIDFGDSWFIDQFIRDNNLYDAIGALEYGNMDSVRAMVMFYVLSDMANNYAEDWWEGNYARILYPKANLSSQRVSDLLASIGEEQSYRSFFARYFTDVLKKTEGGEEVLIDSTGLPNSIHFPLTAISNHNGKISNEIRLIYVVQRNTNLPIFFRYVPGNVIDVSTLTRTIKELKAYNIDTKFAILDAGYLTDDNTQELYREGISFLSRLPEKTKLFHLLVDDCLPTLEKKENFIRFNGRCLYLVKRRVLLAPKGKSRILRDDGTPAEGEGNIAYAYLGRDLMMQDLETDKASLNKDKEYSDGDIYDIRMNGGLFVLYSSRKLPTDKVLSEYYTRQQIEQVFDVCKNNTKMLPLRVQTEETLRGHLMLSFIAAVIVKTLQEQLKNTKMTPEETLKNLRNQKCKVFETKVITSEFVKKANDVIKFFKMKCPVEIPIKGECC